MVSKNRVFITMESTLLFTKHWQHKLEAVLMRQPRNCIYCKQCGGWSIGVPWDDMISTCELFRQPLHAGMEPNVILGTPASTSFLHRCDLSDSVISGSDLAFECKCIELLTAFLNTYAYGSAAAQQHKHHLLLSKQAPPWCRRKHDLKVR